MLGLFKNKKIKDKRINRYATVPADVIKEMWNTYEKYNLSVDPDAFMDGIKNDFQKIVDKKIEIPELDEYVMGAKDKGVSYLRNDSVRQAKENMKEMALYFCKNYAMVYEKNSYITVMLGLISAETCEQVCSEAEDMLVNDLCKVQKKYLECVRLHMDMSYDERMKFKDTGREGMAEFMHDMYDFGNYSRYRIDSVDNVCYVLNIQYKMLYMTEYPYMKKYFYQLALDTKQITEKPENDAVLYMIDKFKTDECFKHDIIWHVKDDDTKDTSYLLNMSENDDNNSNNEYLKEIINIYVMLLDSIRKNYLKTYYGNSFDTLTYNVNISEKLYDNLVAIFVKPIKSIMCSYDGLYNLSGDEESREKLKAARLKYLRHDKNLIDWNEEGIFHELDYHNITSDYKHFILDNFGLPSQCIREKTMINGGLPIKMVDDVLLSAYIEMVSRSMTGSAVNKDGSEYLWIYNLYTEEKVDWF